MVLGRGQNSNHSTEKRVHGMHLSPLVFRLSQFKDSAQFSLNYKRLYIMDKLLRSSMSE